MTIKVFNAHNDSAAQREYRGTPEQVQAQLLVAYPWLRRPTPFGPKNPTLTDDIQRLGQSQGLFVEVEQ
jgi:hypothetical protein